MIYPMKLKANQVKHYREAAVKDQGGECPLCGEELTMDDAVLDHCHETGKIRRALHRSCNAAEGRILSWAGKRSRGDDPVTFLKNLLLYWAGDYSHHPLHHTHGRKPRKRRKTRTRKTRYSNGS